MTQAELMKAISKLESKVEINALWDALKVRSRQLDENAAGSFRVGDRVAYVASKSGRSEAGTVMRVGPKNCVVKLDKDGIQWRVGSSSLTPYTGTSVPMPKKEVIPIVMRLIPTGDGKFREVAAE